MSIMFWVLSKNKQKKKLLHRRHEIQGQVSTTSLYNNNNNNEKKKKRILHMPVSNVSAERTDLESCHGFLSGCGTI